MKTTFVFVPRNEHFRRISECPSYVAANVGREISMVIDLVAELDRRKRASLGALKIVEEAMKEAKEVRLFVHLFDCPVLPKDLAIIDAVREDSEVGIRNLLRYSLLHMPQFPVASRLLATENR